MRGKEEDSLNSDEGYDEKQSRIKGQSGGRKGGCYFTKAVGKVL